MKFSTLFRNLVLTVAAALAVGLIHRSTAVHLPFLALVLGKRAARFS